MMGTEAGIDERIVAALRVIHRQLAVRCVDGKCLRGQARRVFLAEEWIVGRPDSRGVPNTAGSIEHRIVRYRPAVPDSLLPPVRRGTEYRVIVSARRIRVADG